MATEDRREFSGSKQSLSRDLLGSIATSEEAQTEVALSALEFLDQRGGTVRIDPAAGTEDALELRLGGKIFFSVEKFVWESLAAMFGLAISIAAHNPSGIKDAIELAKRIISNVSVFGDETPEFIVYSAVAGLQREESAPKTSAEITKWITASGRSLSEGDVDKAVKVLVDRGLLKDAGGILAIKL